MAAAFNTTEPANGGSHRSAPLILLAVFATIFVLEWAKAVFIPLVLALVVSYAVRPLVDRLERIAVPRGISAAAWSLRDEAGSVIDTLPEAVQKFKDASSRELAGTGKAIERVQRAADEIEEVTAEGERVGLDIVVLVPLQLIHGDGLHRLMHPRPDVRLRVPLVVGDGLQPVVR